MSLAFADGADADEGGMLAPFTDADLLHLLAGDELRFALARRFGLDAAPARVLVLLMAGPLAGLSKRALRHGLSSLDRLVLSANGLGVVIRTIVTAARASGIVGDIIEPTIGGWRISLPARALILSLIAGSA